MTGQRTEIQRTEAVVSNRRDCDAEDTLSAPVEVKAGQVEIASQGVRLEEVVVEPPGLILLPGVGDESIAKFIGEVGEGIVATVAEINGDVGNEGGRDYVIGAEDIATDAAVSFQIVDVEGIRARVSYVRI